MKKHLSFVVLFVWITSVSFGNIAAPVQAPSKMGDVVIPEVFGNPLRIEKETLFIDITGDNYSPARCRAKYIIRNPGGEEVKLPSLFLTPGGKNISVFVDGEKIETSSVFVPHSAIPWAKDDVAFDAGLPEYAAASFEIAFGPYAVRNLEIEFGMQSGYDNTIIEQGMTAPEAFHFLNMFKESESVAWYRFDLVSASAFKGGFGSLSIEVKVPVRNEISTNLGLHRVKEDPEGGYYLLSGEFEGIPEQYLDLKRIHRTNYNSFGITIGAGCSFPFDGSALHFSSKLLFDLFFANSQISAGIEADPFFNLYHGLLVYTHYPSGRSVYGWLADVRGGGGFVFDLANGFSPGFTVFAGMKLIPLAYEISYEIFPFGGKGLIHELSLTIGFGI